MAVPDFQTIMLPLMQALADGKETKMTDVTSALATSFKLTKSELSELLPSGKQPVFNNRIGWSKTHLKKAGLLESSKKGFVKITPLGIIALQQKPETINMAF